MTNPEHNTVDSAETLCQQMASSLVQQQEFSAATLGKAKYCLLDFLSCVHSTMHFPWVQQALAVARKNSSMETGGAQVFGTPHHVSVQDAAFVNAIAGHSLVRDDMHVGSVSHLGVVVLPAALALAENKQVDGKTLLEAIVCGYEAGGKLGSMLMDVETAKRIRPTGLIGSFAAAATGARLNGLDAEQTANALGFASNYFTGLNEWAAWGSDDMYFHPGIAVRNGISALLLAQQGATAAAGSIEGTAGLFAALGKTAPASPVLPFAGQEEIQQVFFKQVPACNYAQTAAQVALKIKQEHALAINEIQAITVKVPYAAANYPGCDYPGPFNSILQARMSIHFNVARALLYGDFNDTHFQDYSSETLQHLSKLITLEIDDALTKAYPEQQGAAIRLTNVNGQTLDANLEDVIPAGTEEVMNRSSHALATVLGEEQSSTLLDLITRLESLNNLDTVFDLLRPENRK
ncbi:MAG: MmgE/PrpD family protein [Gammaproteobacteria bacterium]|nr:MmgE/PrpD family protein [Gammaproteobacteria bacterium]